MEVSGLTFWLLASRSVSIWPQKLPLLESGPCLPPRFTQRQRNETPKESSGPQRLATKNKQNKEIKTVSWSHNTMYVPCRYKMGRPSLPPSPSHSHNTLNTSAYYKQFPVYPFRNFPSDHKHIGIDPPGLKTKQNTHTQVAPSTL